MMLAPLEVFALMAESGERGYERFLQAWPQAVLLDLRLPDVSGMDLLERILAADPVVEVMLMSGDRSTDSAVEAIRKGASDYWAKPFDLDRLRARVTELTEEVERRRRAHELDYELLNAFQFHGVVGRSPVGCLFSGRVFSL